MSGGPEYCTAMRKKAMAESTVKKTKKNYNLPGPGPGRPKGSKNKFTDLKQAFLDAFEQIERDAKKKDAKIKGLYEWAIKNDKNQTVFYQIIARMLPTNVSGDLGGEFKLTVERILTDQRPKE